ncbi:MAG: 2-isopropylmalate synthase [Pseudomonadota bacterium]
MTSEHTDSQDRLIIFDTTLRDGEQAPGCSMTLREKLRVGNALAELGVDVIEAGFPAASPGDFESVQRLAEEIEGPVICGLARCQAQDIERATAALEPAKRKRLHVFVATSAIHREYKLNMARQEILKRAVESVQMARQHFDDVEFSAEDAARTELDFLTEIVTAAIDAGATTVNIPDTVGYTAPAEFLAVFKHLRENVPNIDRAILSVHCHNDLGMAVANSLAAVQGGARQIECTINGIGERAGNCSLEEVVMAVRTRNDLFPYVTGIDTTRLYPLSRMVSNVTGLHVQRNKAIVGENAFAHEAGIHQHGMLKNAETYEIMRPQDVGISRTNLVLGKHSGRHALRERISDLGFDLDDDQVSAVFAEFKKLADSKKEVFDSDIEALVLHGNVHGVGPWVLEEMHVSAGTGRSSTASVRLADDEGHVVEEAAVAAGPVEAVFTALELATGIRPTLKDFDIRSVSVGEDAQGDVSVTVSYEERLYRGQGLETDVIEASAKAFLHALNRIVRTKAMHPAPANPDARRGAA